MQDEHLSLEQFGEAAPRMIPFMHDSSWDQPHVQMHVDFWSAIERHDWRNSRNKHQQRALLVYQGQQRCWWHNCIASIRAFDLSILNDDVLQTMFDNIMVKAHSERMDMFDTVSPFPFPNSSLVHTHLPPPFFLAIISHPPLAPCQRNPNPTCYASLT
ncbi:hypothetical protein JVT61DRAFT_7253 [Boletus reticuloceps]|uniref:Uncharacterized protein n=1 Tax=Boletus reticuloceps TaxID=495285 RepID=A0A8I3A5V8_9AGAM|nr:hypothetical protein JVT61DRAFT_7253 [Boletus reticuloceps]